MPKNWFPLESNPEVMTAYVARLGLDTSLLQFHDVMSTEDWALEMIPRPVVGVLMLYPIKAITEGHREAEDIKIKQEGQICSDNVYYMKQTVGNACGTVGILHALANARSSGLVSVSNSSYLETFFAATATKKPDEIAAYLEEDEALEETHEAAAVEGQSEQPSEDVDTHFICLTHVDGQLYELDGRKSFPINHGPTTPDTLLEDACKVVRKFMERDPDEVRFTIVALAKGE